MDLHACGAPTTQHVGFLWNSTRVALEGMTDIWELNGGATGSSPQACARNLRPGRYAYARTPTRVDFHVFSVYFDSGTANRAYQHRRQASGRLGRVAITSVSLLDRDQDILVLGDYNTMGRQEPPPIAATEEVAAFDRDLVPGFRRLPMTPVWPEYFERKGQALDHILASAEMQEVVPTAHVTGYCAVTHCASRTSDFRTSAP